MVQWSPFLPQMRQTSSEVLLLAILASSSPCFSLSDLGVAR